MRFKHAVDITAENFTSVFKLLLYRFFTAAVLGSIAYVILSLGLSAITGSAEVAHLRELVDTFVHALITADSSVLQHIQGEFQTAVTDLGRLIVFNTAPIIGCVVGLMFIYLLSRFVNGLALFSSGVVVSDRMGTYSRTSFSQAYFRSIGKAALYQVVYVPMCFLYDALTLLSCWFFFFYAPSFLPSWGAVTVLIAVALTITAIVALEALKMTLISAWMPAVIDGKPVCASLRASLRQRKNFGGRYACYIACIYIVIAMNVLFTLATVGSALLITVPLSYIFLLTVQFVQYYNDTGKRYFVSKNVIEDPSEPQPQ